MNTTELAQQETALDWLPAETKAIIYYGLASLKNDAERLIHNNELNPTDNSEDVIQFQQNIVNKCASLQVHFLINNDKQALSLLTHFAPGK